jgi:hypothetical protein
MSDYSLMNLPNRLALQGEELIVHRFPGGSMGLASPSEVYHNTDVRKPFWHALKRLFRPEKACVTAVRIPPATRLVLHDIDEHVRRAYGLQREEECVFEQISAAANTYRDAFRFQNGCRLRLQDAPEALRLTVLNAPVVETEMPLRSAVVSGRRISVSK